MTFNRTATANRVIRVHSLTYPADPPKRNLIDIGGVIAGGLLEDMLSLFFCICRQIYLEQNNFQFKEAFLITSRAFYGIGESRVL